MSHSIMPQKIKTNKKRNIASCKFAFTPKSLSFQFNFFYHSCLSNLFRNMVQIIFYVFFFISAFTPNLFYITSKLQKTRYIPDIDPPLLSFKFSILWSLDLTRVVMGMLQYFGSLTHLPSTDYDRVFRTHMAQFLDLILPQPNCINYFN